MKELKKIGVVFTLALAVAVSGVSAKTVLAAEAAGQETVTESENATAGKETVTESENVASDEEKTEKADESDEEKAEKADESDEEKAEKADESDEETVVAEAVENEPAAACEAVSLLSLDAEPAAASVDGVELEDAYGYTTWTDKNYFDPETMKNEVRLEGEAGEELSTIFKVNFIGADTTSFEDDENLTGYCTNLPSGLEVIKYTKNRHINMMRVELKGTAEAGNYEVVFTVPTEKLIARDGYQLPENGISVTIYLTVNGHLIPVTVPEPTSSPSHEHSHEWKVINQATDSQDGLEAYMCSCGDIEATRVISAYGLWLDSVEQQILNAEENAVVEIKTEIWNTYSKDIMDALTERSDVTLVTTFGAGEEAVTFTIPAGACTLIEDEATALAGSVEDAAGVAPSAEETQWFGWQFLAGAYNN